jgi:hypothetical protein
LTSWKTFNGPIQSGYPFHCYHAVIRMIANDAEPGVPKSSATGTRTRVARVRAEYPNQLDYSGRYIDTLKEAQLPIPSASANSDFRGTNLAC